MDHVSDLSQASYESSYKWKINNFSNLDLEEMMRKFNICLKSRETLIKEVNVKWWVTIAYDLNHLDRAHEPIMKFVVRDEGENTQAKFKLEFKVNDQPLLVTEMMGTYKNTIDYEVLLPLHLCYHHNNVIELKCTVDTLLQRNFDLSEVDHHTQEENPDKTFVSPSDNLAGEILTMPDNKPAVEDPERTSEEETSSLNSVSSYSSTSYDMEKSETDDDNQTKDLKRKIKNIFMEKMKVDVEKSAKLPGTSTGVNLVETCHYIYLILMSCSFRKISNCKLRSLVLSSHACQWKTLLKSGILQKSLRIDRLRKLLSNSSSINWHPIKVLPLMFSKPICCWKLFVLINETRK